MISSTIVPFSARIVSTPASNVTDRISFVQATSMSLIFVLVVRLFFNKQKTAYEMRISDCSSAVCASDLNLTRATVPKARCPGPEAFCHCGDIGQRAHLALPFGFDGEQACRRRWVDALTKHDFIDDRHLVGADRLDAGIERTSCLRGIDARFNKAEILVEEIGREHV